VLVKRYHAKDMQAAMEVVKRELGPDAVILNSRKTRRKGFKNLFSKRILEVMVAYEPEKAPIARKINGYLSRQQTEPAVPARAEAEEEPQSAEPDNGETLKRLNERIETLGQMVAGLIDKFGEFAAAEPERRYPESLEALVSRLTENRVDGELAHTLARDALDIIAVQPGVSAEDVMEQLILDLVGVPEPVLHRRYKRKTVLVLGPTGVGKTTSIVKLAANFALKQNKKVGIINTDMYRIGANEQMKTYTDILSIPFGAVYQLDELGGVIESMRDRDIIFIDTAGKKPGDDQHREDVLEIIRIARPEDMLLCVPASTSFSAVKEIIDAYEFAGDFKLVVTKLDETDFRGMLLNLIWYARKSPAYVTTGQNVPDDIDVLDAAGLAERLLH
jgi:flagellar biosynthesis protein FlhF